MIDRVRSFLGRASTIATAQRVDVDDTNAKPVLHPYGRLLANLRQHTLVTMREDVTRRGEEGLPIGRVCEIRDAQGRVINYRRMRYRTMLECAVDEALSETEIVDEARAAAIRADLPLVRHFELRERLAELTHAQAPRNARVAPRIELEEYPAVPPIFDEFTLEARLAETRAAARRAEVDRRNFVRSQTASIEAERNLGLMHTAADDWNERAELMSELAQWETDHASLAAEIRVWEDRGHRK